MSDNGSYVEVDAHGYGWVYLAHTSITDHVLKFPVEAIEALQAQGWYSVPPPRRKLRLRVADIAAALRIKPSTWTAYVSRGKAPAPDGRFGREPWWHPATIQAWQADRPRARKAT